MNPKNCASGLRSCSKRWSGNGFPYRIVRGMELWAVGRLEEKIRSGRLISLNGSRFFLTEVPFDAEPEEIRARLTEILDLGKVPVLAHPERYYCVQDRPNWLFEWRMLGVLAQMNKGKYFWKIRTEDGEDRRDSSGTIRWSPVSPATPTAWNTEPQI